MKEFYILTFKFFLHSSMKMERNGPFKVLEALSFIS